MKLAQDASVVPPADVPVETGDDSIYEDVVKNHMSPEESLCKSLNIPSRSGWQICDRCRGHGTIDNPSLHSFDGPSLEDQFAEDDSFQEDYMAGVHDVACDECHGSGKVKVTEPILDRVSSEIRTQYLARLQEWQQYQSQERAEKAMRDRGVQF